MRLPLTRPLAMVLSRSVICLTEQRTLTFGAQSTLFACLSSRVEDLLCSSMKGSGHVA